MKQFGAFRFDGKNECLWRGTTRVPLTPKAFLLLRFLVDRSGTLVGQNELIENLWPDTFVQPEVLKTHIRDLRAALGDDARAPRFIETQHRRGYRFIAPVQERGENGETPRRAPSAIVGQERQLEELLHIYSTASEGNPQLVFLTGEVGIGKTALANSLECEIFKRSQETRVVRGLCIQGYGGKEPYYPVFEAISHLLRLPGREAVVEALTEFAPTWLAQFPALIKKDERDTLFGEVAGATPERMLRELCDAMGVIAAETPVVMILEDVHWADAYTVDWINVFARRQWTAKLMLIATSRPVDLILSDNPLRMVKRQLLARRLCHKIAVSPLSQTSILRYLEAKSPDGQIPPGLAELVYSHSDGNPLFMESVLEHLISQGLLHVEGGHWRTEFNAVRLPQIVPESIRQLMDTHIDTCLSDGERCVLEAASVCGVSFAALMLTSAADLNQEQIEEICVRLAGRQQFIHCLGAIDLPNGAVSSHCEFTHSLYREIFLQRIPPARRARLHREIALRLESVYEGQLEQVAPRLAYHFELSSEWRKSAVYLTTLAEIDAKRFTYRDAIRNLDHALELLAKLPTSETTVIVNDIYCRLIDNYALVEDFVRALEIVDKGERMAIESGNVHCRIRMLLRLGWLIFRIDRNRCLDANNLMLQLIADDPNPYFRAEVLLKALAMASFCFGSTDEDVRKCEEALVELRKGADSRSLAQCELLCGVVQALVSNFREALHHLNASLPALAAGDMFFRRGQHIRTRVWLLCGDWGTSFRHLDSYVKSAIKDGSKVVEQLWNCQLVWAHYEAFNFEATIDLAQQAIEVLQARAHVWARLQSIVLMGAAETQLGKLDDARLHLKEAAALFEEEQACYDWYGKLFLYRAQVELAIAANQLSEAEERAQTFLNAAMGTSQRTWHGLALEASARVALLLGDLPRAREAISAALAAIEDFEVPIARWRVHRTAMEAFPEEAGRHHSLAVATVETLAASLGDFSQIKEALLSFVEIRELLLPHPQAIK